MHSGFHVGVSYHLLTWTLLHAHNNYKAIKLSSMGEKAHYFMERKGEWRINFGGVLIAFA